MARRVQVKRGNASQGITLSSTVVPTRAVAGAAAPARSNSLLDLSKALAEFNPELRRYVDITDRKQIAEDLAKGQAQALGIQYEGTKSAINKLVRSGELPSGSSPVMALGLLMQRGQNQAQAAHAGLMNESSKFLDPSTSLEEAAAFADSHFSQSMGVVASDPLVLGSITGIISNSKRNFMKKVVSERTAAFEQEARANLDFRVADAVDLYSNLEPGASDEDISAAQGELSTQLKTMLGEFRGLGYKNANVALAKTVANQAIRIAEDDPDEARDLLEVAEQLDVTGKGGLLGSVSDNISVFRNANNTINSMEDKESPVDKRNENLLDVFQDVAKTAAGEGRGITDSELESLTQQSDGIFEDDLATGRGELKKLFNAFNSPVKENKVNMSETLRSLALTTDTDQAREINTDAFKQGDITSEQFLYNENFIKSIKANSRVFVNEDGNDSRDINTENIQKTFNEVELSITEMIDFKEQAGTDLLKLARPLAEQANQPVTAFIQDPVNQVVIQELKDEANKRLGEGLTNLLQSRQKVIDDKRAEEAATLVKFRTDNPRLTKAAQVRKPNLFKRWFGDEAGLLGQYTLLHRKLQAESFGPLKVNNVDIEADVILDRIKDLEDELRGDIVSLAKAGDTEEYFRLKGVLGYSINEITDGWTDDGLRIDKETINPINTLIFNTTEELVNMSDEDFDALAKELGVPFKRLGAAQKALLKERGRLIE